MSPRHRLLIVDDEASLLDFLSLLFQQEGYDVDTAPLGRGGAASSCERASLDLVLCDILMPDGNGLDLLREIKARERPRPPVIMMTAYTSTKSAIEAMKLGAADYISKPFDVEELKIVVQKALERAELDDENVYLRRELEQKYTFANIIGKSPRMQAIFSLVERIARTTSTVLIPGESGTGKELIARAIHFASPRAARRFVSINCGAHAREPARERALRPRARRLHRRRARQEGALPGGRPRHPLPRRDRRDDADDAGEAAARPAGEGRAQGRRHRRGAGRRARSSPPPTGTSSDAHRRRRASARTSTTASTSSRSTCRRCASGARTSRCWSSSSSSKYCEQMDMPPQQISVEAMQIARELRLAGQRARAGEPDRAHARPLARRDDHHPRPARAPPDQPADQPRPRAAAPRRGSTSRPTWSRSAPSSWCRPWSAPAASRPRPPSSSA